MKVQSIGGLLVVLLVLNSMNFSNCGAKKINTDFLNLLSSKTSVRSSQDAIQSVLTLLEDLQGIQRGEIVSGANVEAQENADETYS